MQPASAFDRLLSDVRDGRAREIERVPLLICDHFHHARVSHIRHRGEPPFERTHAGTAGQERRHKVGE